MSPLLPRYESTATDRMSMALATSAVGIAIIARCTHYARPPARLAIAARLLPEGSDPSQLHMACLIHNPSENPEPCTGKGQAGRKGRVINNGMGTAHGSRPSPPGTAPHCNGTSCLPALGVRMAQRRRAGRRRQGRQAQAGRQEGWLAEGGSSVGGIIQNRMRWSCPC